MVDNDGGGIFSFLPQAAALDRTRFEQLFGTPHGASITGLAAAHGLAATELRSRSEFEGWLGHPATGVRLGVVLTDRSANVAVHDTLHRVVAHALG